MLIKNICKNIEIENSEKNKNMIRGIHYFSAEVKPKLMSSQGAALNLIMLNCLFRY